MGEEYSKELCDERHLNINKLLEKIDKNFDVLFNRLNWFYLTAIGTLAAALSSIILTVIRLKG